MFLGIEIGGTKLQLGVGDGLSPRFVDFARAEINPAYGAGGILDRIESLAPALIQRHGVTRIGIGFGGPVDAAGGRVVKSHQIEGWNDFPLARWCEGEFGLPTTLGNDCDCAALAEALYGAGRNADGMFYVTVGTGVGGGFVVDGKLHGARRPAVAEIGHLRPGLHDDRPELTVESICSGWGIAAAARSYLEEPMVRSMTPYRSAAQADTPEQRRRRLLLAKETEREYVNDLLTRCEQSPERLTAKHVAQAAGEGNEIARDVLDHAACTLGWAIAQTITLLAPEVVAIGGGVSLMDASLFLDPVRDYAAKYVFPPLAGSYRIVPAELGESVVVHGAIAIARTAAAAG